NAFRLRQPGVIPVARLVTQVEIDRGEDGKPEVGHESPGRRDILRPCRLGTGAAGETSRPHQPGHEKKNWKTDHLPGAPSPPPSFDHEFHCAATPFSGAQPCS